MANTDIITTDDIDPIVLNDGTVLNAQQSLCAVLSVVTKKKHNEIANICGYAHKGSVSKFLNSRIGKEARGVALRDYLQDAAEIAIHQLVSLAKGSKSDLVRMHAAKDLADRAGVRLTVSETSPDKGQAPAQINITIGRDAVADLKDVTP